MPLSPPLFGSQSPPLRQQVHDGDPAGELALDNDRDVMTGPIIDVVAIPGGGWIRLGVDLDLKIAQVDDPVNRDPGSGINRELLAAVCGQAFVRDLDHQAAISGRRIARGVVFQGV